MVLHHGITEEGGGGSRSFSPLLVGDGLASPGAIPRASASSCFSPLLVGDGLASYQGYATVGLYDEFQSPSRRGWSCIGKQRLRHLHVELGFSPLLVGDGLASIRSSLSGEKLMCFSPLL